MAAQEVERSRLPGVPRERVLLARQDGVERAFTGLGRFK